MAMLAEPKRKQKIGPNPRGQFFTDDKKNRGRNMLERMGWSSGDGLGVAKQGTVEPIKPKVQTDARGLGCGINDSRLVQAVDDFEQVLSDLNNEHGSNVVEISSANSKDLDQFKTNVKSRNAKSRIRYHKIMKNKDLSKTASKDWGCIFGRSVDTKAEQVQNDHIRDEVLHTSDGEDYPKENEKKIKKRKRTATVKEEEAFSEKGVIEESIVDKAKKYKLEDKFVSMGSSVDYFKKKMAQKLNKPPSEPGNEKDRLFDNENRVKIEESLEGIKSESSEVTNDSTYNIAPHTKALDLCLQGSSGESNRKKCKKEKNNFTSQKVCTVLDDNNERNIAAADLTEHISDPVGGSKRKNVKKGRKSLPPELLIEVPEDVYEHNVAVREITEYVPQTPGTSEQKKRKKKNCTSVPEVLVEVPDEIMEYNTLAEQLTEFVVPQVSWKHDQKKRKNKNLSIRDLFHPLQNATEHNTAVARLNELVLKTSGASKKKRRRKENKSFCTEATAAGTDDTAVAGEPVDLKQKGSGRTSRKNKKRNCEYIFPDSPTECTIGNFEQSVKHEAVIGAGPEPLQGEMKKKSKKRNKSQLKVSGEDSRNGDDRSEGIIDSVPGASGTTKQKKQPLISPDFWYEMVDGVFKPVAVVDEGMTHDSVSPRKMKIKKSKKGQKSVLTKVLSDDTTVDIIGVHEGKASGQRSKKNKKRNCEYIFPDSPTECTIGNFEQSVKHEAVIGAGPEPLQGEMKKKSKKRNKSLLKVSGEDSRNGDDRSEGIIDSVPGASGTTKEKKQPLSPLDLWYEMVDGVFRPVALVDEEMTYDSVTPRKRKIKKSKKGQKSILTKVLSDDNINDIGVHEETVSPSETLHRRKYKRIKKDGKSILPSGVVEAESKTVDSNATIQKNNSGGCNTVNDEENTITGRSDNNWVHDREKVQILNDEIALRIIAKKFIGSNLFEIAGYPLTGFKGSHL